MVRPQTPASNQASNNNNNNSPSPSVAPSSPVFARTNQPPPSPSLNDKIRALSQWGENALTNDIIPKLLKTKIDAKNASSLNDALKIAQLAAALKPEVEKMQSLIEGCNQKLLLTCDSMRSISYRQWQSYWTTC